MATFKGTQHEKILHFFKGTGKTFTTRMLKSRFKISSPGARLWELKEKGYDIRSQTISTGSVGRPASAYQVMRNRVA